MAGRKDTDTERTDAEARNGAEQDNGRGTANETLISELSSAVRDAAMEVLGPAAREATSSAAKYAIKKGPELMKDNVMPALDKQGGAGPLAQQALSRGGDALSGAGGVAGAVGKLASKLGGRGGGGDASGWGRNRRMPVQQWVYVSVPVRDAYNAWTEYKQWPRYMHRANQVDAQIDERQARVRVTEKMWGFKRPFSAEVVCQRPDEHIRWNSTEGTKHTGVINFHELAPRLTLVEVNLDHAPSGIAEKIARGARFTKRAVRADLHRYQAWVEMKSDDELAELEGWRGRIEDGQIVQSHEDAVEEEQRSDAQEDADSGSGREHEFDEPEGDEDETDGPQGEADDYFEDPEDDDGALDESDATSEDDFDEPQGENDDEYEAPGAEREGEDEYDEAEAESADEFEEPEAETDDEFEEPEAESDDDEPEEEPEEEPRPRRRRSNGDRASSSRAPRRRQRTAAAR
jgi:uncharacterized membrane protein